MFISAMFVRPSVHVETLIPTGRICEKTYCVDFTKISVEMFPFRLKLTKNNTLLGDKVVWLQAVVWLPRVAFIISVRTSCILLQGE